MINKNDMMDSPLILVADDDPAIRQMLSISLKKQNYRVAEAENGQQVLAYLEHDLPTILVLDLGMPVMNGPEVCGAIRESGLPISIIAMTAYDGLNLKISVFDAGADDYVTKPFILEEFMARVRALLRRSKNSF